MAQAEFTEQEMTSEDGEIIKYLEGTVMTRRDKLVVRLIQIKEDGACINANDYTHNAEVKATYGEFIAAGAAWTKRNADGTLYYSVALNDPQLNMSLWPDDENEGHWIARANNIRAAA